MNDLDTVRALTELYEHVANIKEAMESLCEAVEKIIVAQDGLNRRQAAVERAALTAGLRGVVKVD